MKKNPVGLKTIIVVLALMVAGFFIYDSRAGSSAREADQVEAAAPAEARSVPVKVTPVRSRRFEDRLVLQGNLEAGQSAKVPALVSGTIMEIFVKEGDAVRAGETELFRTDPLKSEKAVEVSRQGLAVARCGLLEKKANLESVNANWVKARIDYRRYITLRDKGTVSADEFEQVEARYLQARAGQKHARTLIELAAEQVRQAEVALEIAEKDLRDTLVKAPISGRVAERYKELGEMGNRGDEILRIEDPALIEASAFLPARYYARIRSGRTPVRLEVYDRVLEGLVVTYKSPTIDLRLRTFEIKARIENPPEDVVPGAMAGIVILLDEHDALGVPASAVQKRGGRDVLFVAADGRARMVPVELGLESEGWVEVRGDGLSPDSPVVTQGQFLLKDGSPVVLSEGGE